MLQLKSPWREGTTHISPAPLEFMQRLAALVPRLHLIRFHGVLAPHARLRAAIVPGPGAHRRRACRRTRAPRAGAHGLGATAPARVFDIDLEHCPQCGGEFKIIAAIEAPALLVRNLTHLALPARAPPRSPTRPLDLFQAA